MARYEELSVTELSIGSKVKRDTRKLIVPICGNAKAGATAAVTDIDITHLVITVDQK